MLQGTQQQVLNPKLMTISLRTHQIQWLTCHMCRTAPNIVRHPHCYCSGPEVMSCSWQRAFEMDGGAKHGYNSNALLQAHTEQESSQYTTAPDTIHRILKLGDCQIRDLEREMQAHHCNHQAYANAEQITLSHSQLCVNNTS